MTLKILGCAGCAHVPSINLYFTLVVLQSSSFELFLKMTPVLERVFNNTARNARLVKSA